MRRHWRDIFQYLASRVIPVSRRANCFPCVSSLASLAVYAKGVECGGARVSQRQIGRCDRIDARRLRDRLLSGTMLPSSFHPIARLTLCVSLSIDSMTSIVVVVAGSIVVAVHCARATCVTRPTHSTARQQLNNYFFWFSGVLNFPIVINAIRATPLTSPQTTLIVRSLMSTLGFPIQ